MLKMPKNKIPEFVLIDDSFVVRQVIKALLGRTKLNGKNVRVLSSSNGLEGLGLAMVSKPDVIILDSTLPRYSGRELVEFLSTNPRYSGEDAPSSIIVMHFDGVSVKLPHNYVLLNKKRKEFLTELLNSIDLELYSDIAHSSKFNRFVFKVAQCAVKWDNRYERWKEKARDSKKKFTKFLQLGISLLSRLFSTVSLTFLYLLIGRGVDANVEQEKGDLALYRAKMYPAAAVFVGLTFLFMMQIILSLTPGVYLYGYRVKSLLTYATEQRKYEVELDKSIYDENLIEFVNGGLRLKRLVDIEEEPNVQEVIEPEAEEVAEATHIEVLEDEGLDPVVEDESSPDEVNEEELMEDELILAEPDTVTLADPPEEEVLGVAVEPVEEQEAEAIKEVASKPFSQHSPMISSSEPIPYARLLHILEDSNSENHDSSKEEPEKGWESNRITYQLSPDGEEWYYYSKEDEQWMITEEGAIESNIVQEVNFRLEQYEQLVDASQLYLRAYLNSDGDTMLFLSSLAVERELALVEEVIESSGTVVLPQEKYIDSWSDEVVDKAQVTILNASYVDGQKIVGGRVKYVNEVDIDLDSDYVYVYYTGSRDISAPSQNRGEYIGRSSIEQIAINGQTEYVFTLITNGQPGGYITAELVRESEDEESTRLIKQRVSQLSRPVENSTFSVTQTGDQSDANPGDGLCDIDPITAGNQCTLRAAMEEAAALAGADTITFDILTSDVNCLSFRDNGVSGTYDPSAGEIHCLDVAADPYFKFWRIAPTSSLSDFSADNLIINGSTQTGYSANTQSYPATINGNPVIEIVGSFRTGSSPINLQLQNVVLNSSSTIIEEATDFTGNLTVTGSYLGTDISGLLSKGTPNQLINLKSTSSIGTVALGGDTASNRNVINSSAISTIKLDGTTSTVRGNIIGLNKDLVALRTASGSQIHLLNDKGSTLLNNRISGGVISGLEVCTDSGTAITGNTITGNGKGVTVTCGAGVAMRSNAIHTNADLAIDLGADGRTTNDSGDLDSGINDLQNYPEITEIVYLGESQYRVKGTLDSKLDRAPFDVEVCLSNESGECVQSLGSVSIDLSTDWEVTVTIGGSSGEEDYILVGLATNVNGSTSELGDVYDVKGGDVVLGVPYHVMTIGGYRGAGEFNRPRGIYADGSGKMYVVDTENHRIQVFDSEGKFLIMFGSYGSGDGQFNNPNGVAVDGSGKIYVADTVNHRVQAFDNEGNFLMKFGSYGSGEGQFNNPKGVAVDGNGKIYVADTSNRRVQIFDNEGNFLMKFGSYGSGDGQFNDPNGIAVDGNGKIYVADTTNRRVQVFGNEGDFLMKFNSHHSGLFVIGYPYGISVDGNGKIYVTYAADNRIEVFDSDGIFLMEFGDSGQFNYAYGVSVDDDGKIYVADTFNYRIQLFDNEGNFLAKLGGYGDSAGKLSEPDSVAVDDNGKIYVADTYNHRVQAFDNEGNFLMKFGGYGSGEGQFNNPKGVAVDGNGKIYVADTSNRRVQIFDNEGNFLMKFGSYGSGDGQFMFPRGVALDRDGKIYVADQYNNRVQTFDNEGDFLMKFGSSGSGDGQFSSLNGIAVDDNGNIYVADQYNNRVQTFDNEGDFLMKFGSSGSGDGQFSRPSSLSVDGNGRIYVADTFNRRVQIFDNEGNFLMKFSSSGSGDWESSRLVDISIDRRGYIYLVDSYNHSIEVFSFDKYPPSVTLSSPKNKENILINPHTGIAADDLVGIKKVEYALSTEPGSWFSCVADSGEFTGKLEQFSCPALTQLADGYYTINLRVYDNYNKKSEEELQILVDSSGPVGAVSIVGDAEYVNSQTVSLQLDAEDELLDVESMMISNYEDFESAVWESYSQTKEWSLTEGEGEKLIYVKFKDEAGNVSGVSTLRLLLTSEAVKGGVTINGGEKYTNDREVILNMNIRSQTAPVASMIIGHDIGFTNSSWETYKTERNWTLTDGDGIKFVYVKYIDQAGNESQIYIGSIILDTAVDFELDFDGMDLQYDTESGRYISYRNKPEFSGTGEVGLGVAIDIGEGEVIGETEANEDGYWSWKSDEELGVGVYLVSISFTDSADNVHSVQFELEIRGFYEFGMEIAAVYDHIEESMADWRIYILLLALVIPFIVLLAFLIKRRREQLISLVDKSISKKDRS